MSEQTRQRDRRRGGEMTLSELRKREFLTGVQAAKYCGMAPRTFYSYVSAGLISRYYRPTTTNTEKPFYSREQLDNVLRPRPLMVKLKYIQEQTKASSTAKRKRS